jgi:hypothetical protein
MADAMPEKCHDCPFGNSKAQRHMRKSLRRGRFAEICRSVWVGGYFPCHKTIKYDEEGEYVPSRDEKQCAGANQFIADVEAGRKK